MATVTELNCFAEESRVDLEQKALLTQVSSLFTKTVEMLGYGWDSSEYCVGFHFIAEQQGFSSVKGLPESSFDDPYLQRLRWSCLLINSLYLLIFMNERSFNRRNQHSELDKNPNLTAWFAVIGRQSARIETQDPKSE